MNCIQSWPEPIIRVQSLSENGLQVIPTCYIKHFANRPSSKTLTSEVNIPIIDFQNLFSSDIIIRDTTFSLISSACREWGFFQLVNHGVSHDLMIRTRTVWEEFFHLPIEEKQVYANSPDTYEGYGSRVGIEKGATLDWSDYFFLHYLPLSLKDQKKWPSIPTSCRELVEEYGEELVKLCEKLMKILSINLGMGENYLEEAFGSGEELVGSSCLRVNFYPKCPQPHLTLGLSPHSDPGGITLLLPDYNVSGLQVRTTTTGDHTNWLTVNPIPNAFIVNIGDQIQVLSNATYKSVEHRVIVNSVKERVSLAFFYNPNGDKIIEPAKEFVTDDRPALYQPMTFNQYRSQIRTKGPCGKSLVESFKFRP